MGRSQGHTFSPFCWRKSWRAIIRQDNSKWWSQMSGLAWEYHCSWKAGLSESNTENKLFWCYLLENVREMTCLSLGMALREGTCLRYRFRKGKPWPWQTNQEELLCSSPLMWIEPSYCSPLSACGLVSVAHKPLEIGACESSLEAGFEKECSVDLEDWLGFFPPPPKKCIQQKSAVIKANVCHGPRTDTRRHKEEKSKI